MNVLGGDFHEIDSRSFFPLHPEQPDRRQEDLCQDPPGASRPRAGAEQPKQLWRQRLGNTAAPSRARSLGSSARTLATPSGPRVASGHSDLTGRGQKKGGPSSPPRSLSVGTY